MSKITFGLIVNFDDLVESITKKFSNLYINKPLSNRFPENIKESINYFDFDGFSLTYLEILYYTNFELFIKPSSVLNNRSMSMDFLKMETDDKSISINHAMINFKCGLDIQIDSYDKTIIHIEIDVRNPKQLFHQLSTILNRLNGKFDQIVEYSKSPNYNWMHGFGSEHIDNHMAQILGYSKAYTTLKTY